MSPFSLHVLVHFMFSISLVLYSFFFHFKLDSFTQVKHVIFYSMCYDLFYWTPSLLPLYNYTQSAKQFAYHFISSTIYLVVPFPIFLSINELIQSSKVHISFYVLPFILLNPFLSPSLKLCSFGQTVCILFYLMSYDLFRLCPFQSSFL